MCGCGGGLWAAAASGVTGFVTGVDMDLSVPACQHGADDDAGDGDVEPDGVGPAGELAVRAEAAREREEECDEHQGSATTESRMWLIRMAM